MKPRFLFVLTAAWFLLSSDKPKVEPPKGDKYCTIPKGAVTVPLAHVEQPDDYSCGAAAFMSVASFYGVGPKSLAGFKKNLGTNPKDGTYYQDMVDYAHKLDLESRAEPDMSLKQLRAYLKEGKPVICSIQAYADDPKVYDDPNNNESGHYVVAVGYDEDHVFFMDPSINWSSDRYGPRRAFLSNEEFEKRWHENEAPTGKPPEIYQHLGIVVYPKEGQTPFLTRARHVD